MNPLGILTNMYKVAASTTTKVAITAGRTRKAHCRLRSYTESIPSKNFSVVL